MWVRYLERSKCHLKQCLSNTVGEHFWSKAFLGQNPGIAMKKKDSFFSFVEGKVSVSECAV